MSFPQECLPSLATNGCLSSPPNPHTKNTLKAPRRIGNSHGAIGLIGLLLATLCAICGCGDEDSQAQAHKQHSHAQGQGPGSERQDGRPAQPATPVAVQTATSGSIASYYNATTTLEAEKEAEILARVEGVVQSIYCEEGDLIKSGEVLLRIDNEEYQLRLDQSTANTANLRSKYERVAKMLEEELATEEEFQTAKSELATAEADEGMARLSVSYINVTAPFDGKVVQRLVDVGQNINLGSPLFVLADFNPLLARIHVPSKEFKKLKIDQIVTLILDSSQQRLQGRIKLISPIIDPSSGTIKITVEAPDYPPNTRPGDFAQVQIVTERREDTILVPKIAVFSDKGEDVIYIAKENVAERRVVEVGFRDNDNAEIITGAAIGDLVVVKGQRSLKNGDPLKILGLEESETDSVAQSGES